MTQPVKNYLLTVFIDKPASEHAKIKDIIHEISGGNSQVANIHQTELLIVFSTHLTPSQIDRSLDGAILSDDRFLLVELGRDWACAGLSKAANWLRRTLGDPT